MLSVVTFFRGEIFGEEFAVETEIGIAASDTELFMPESSLILFARRTCYFGSKQVDTSFFPLVFFLTEFFRRCKYMPFVLGLIFVLLEIFRDLKFAWKIQ